MSALRYRLRSPPPHDGRMRRWARQCSSFLALFLLVACTENPSLPEGSRPLQVTIVPDTLVVPALGATAAFSLRAVNGPSPAGIWTSTNPQVATVDAVRGIVTAEALGSARIVFSFEGGSASAVVVVEQVPAAIVLNGWRDTLIVGETVPFSSEVLDANGNRIEDLEVQVQQSGEGRIEITDSTVMPVEEGVVSVAFAADGVRVEVIAHVFARFAGWQPEGWAGACAAALSGFVYCWGSNDSGEFGTGGPGEPSPRPIRVEGIAGATKAASGNGVACALTQQQTAYCWGNNDRGQTGTGSTAPIVAPAPVAGNHRFIALSNPISHACGVDETGQAWCWGFGSNGRLGYGGSDDQASPVAVAQNSLVFQDVRTSGIHSCAITDDGEIWCWGHGRWFGRSDDVDTPVRWDPSRTYDKLIVAQGLTCGITGSGGVYCTGSFAIPPDSYQTFHTDPTAVAPGTPLKGFAVAANSQCGIDFDDRIVCWGLPTNGGLGNGSATTIYSVPTHNLLTESVTHIAAFSAGSADMFCAITGRSELYCWGKTPSWEGMGGNVYAPREVASPSVGR